MKDQFKQFFWNLQRDFDALQDCYISGNPFCGAAGPPTGETRLGEGVPQQDFDALQDDLMEGIKLGTSSVLDKLKKQNQNKLDDDDAPNLPNNVPNPPLDNP